jgi:3-methyladenine DNA glycosylase AlkD
MTARKVLQELKAFGTAQTRKTYGRHGVTGNMYGVKYGDLAKLVKRIKVDHDLALALWDSGNHDARVLATMIAEPERLTARVLGAWIKDVDNHVLSCALAGIGAKSPAGRKIMPKWMAAKGEWPAATGWMMLSNVAAVPDAVPKPKCRELLKTIEKRIHGSPNRVKYSMNTALISLGAYTPGLEHEAVKTAERIGQVEVDHGLTNCQTPLAAPYIRKAAAHHRAKLAKAAAKKKGTKKKSARRTAR